MYNSMGAASVPALAMENIYVCVDQIQAVVIVPDLVVSVIQMAMGRVTHQGRRALAWQFWCLVCVKVSEILVLQWKQRCFRSCRT